MRRSTRSRSARAEPPAPPPQPQPAAARAGARRSLARACAQIADPELRACLESLAGAYRRHDRAAGRRRRRRHPIPIIPEPINVIRTRTLFLACRRRFRDRRLQCRKGQRRKPPPRPARSSRSPPPNNGDWTTIVAQTPEGGFLMGNPNAKVKLVEFGSMTCPHCAEFDETACKPLIDNYVKTGLVSCEFRNFVRDPYRHRRLAGRPLRRRGQLLRPDPRASTPTSGTGSARSRPPTRRSCRRSRTCRPTSSSSRSPRSPASSNGRRCAACRAAKTDACLANQAEVDQLVQMNSDATSQLSTSRARRRFLHQRRAGRSRPADLGASSKPQDQGSARRLSWARRGGDSVADSPAEAQRLQELRRAG